MAPFAWMPKEAANFVWFTLTAAMACTLVIGSIAALPDRRLAVRRLVWLTLLLNGKFLVRELVFGQFNLLTALILLAAIVAAQHGRVRSPGVLVALGVFVKPYALVLVPWLAGSGTVAQIARSLGCSLSTARRRLLRRCRNDPGKHGVLHAVDRKARRPPAHRGKLPPHHRPPHFRIHQRAVGEDVHGGCVPR